MGLKAHFLNLMLSTINERYPNTSGLKILELGNQEVRPNQGFFEKTGKEFWTNRGFKHVSVDVNGLHGSLIKDLTEIEDFLEFKDEFDIVYNAGTTEHVEPYEDQYVCYQIIDMCCKPGGLMIHSVPEINNRDQRGMWRDHCHYYYSEEFFNTLAEQSDYDMLYLNVSPRIITSIMQKKETSSFMKDKEKFLSNIAIRNQDANFSGNSDYTHQNKQAVF